MRRSRAGSLLAGMVVVAVAGCGLPLPRGVHVGGDVPAEQRDPSDIQVLPPGPAVGAAPIAVVQGFISAESSPEGQHAIARQYLTADARWVDKEVQVYDPASLRITESKPGPTSADRESRSGRNSVGLSVVFTKLGLLTSDGEYSSIKPTRVKQAYTVVRGRNGEWRISSPPSGLRLTPADRDRSFRARRLFYLSPSLKAPVHVVPDLVLLPVGQHAAQAAVERLLQAPSEAIAGSVTTAFPAGTRLLSLRSEPGGLYRVDLSSDVERASDQQRRALSAQLVWTLRGLDARFHRLRLTAAGKPLAVPGEDEVQNADDWTVFDPEGLADGPLYFVAGGRLRTTTSGASVGAGPPASRGLDVDAVAVTPDRTQIAVLHKSGAGVNGGVTLRIGPVTAASYPSVLSAPGLSSPSWGSGEFGLWLLDGSGHVLLVRSGGRPVHVAVEGVSGPITALAVSRDGTRVAVVSEGVLYVGRVGRGADGPGVVRVVPVAPELTGVTQVVWRDGTSLVALGALSETFVPVVLTVDGSSVRSLAVSGLPSKPVEVAASSLGTVVTASGRLYLLSTLGFRVGPAGRAPAYPG